MALSGANEAYGFRAAEFFQRGLLVGVPEGGKRRTKLCVIRMGQWSFFQYRPIQSHDESRRQKSTT